METPETSSTHLTGLDDGQMLLLSTLIYALARDVEVERGMSVTEVVRDADSGLKRAMAELGTTMGEIYAESMTFEEWFAVIDGIRRDEHLCALIIDSFGRDERGATMAAFSNAGGDAYIVFRGTGFGEWEDDCLAAFQADSEQQLRALGWFEEEVVSKGYRTVTVSGHSKGGNKAQYLAVRAGDAIDRAVSFDGEGFSQEFLEAYAPDIERHASKIRAYALDNDYVNGLLEPLVDGSRRHYIVGAEDLNMKNYHSPFSLFAPREDGVYNLILGEEGPQGEVGRTAVRLTEYLKTIPTRDEYIRMCAFLGGALNRKMAIQRGIDVATPVIRKEDRDDLILMLAHTMSFFHGIGKDTSAADIIALLMPSARKHGASSQFNFPARPEWLDTLAARADAAKESRNVSLQSLLAAMRREDAASRFLPKP